MAGGLLTEIFTIGHSTHSLEGFLALLSQWDIACVCDVRSYPRSRHVPHFNSDVLAAACERRGVLYRHMPGLGGRRRSSADSPNRGWKNKAFRAYADHMDSDEFRAGLEELCALAERSRAVVMCAEALWWRCHRRLIADAVCSKGFQATHIGFDGSSERHVMTEFCVNDGKRLLYPGPELDWRI
jgi:uncharacterized protein (DUF488 family)